MGFDFQNEIFEDVIDDEMEKNDIPMDVNIGIETFGDLQFAQKHMTREFKDDYSNDDPIIDISNQFIAPTMVGEFSIYVIPCHLFSTIFKWRCEIKKISYLATAFYRSHQEKETMTRD